MTTKTKALKTAKAAAPAKAKAARAKKPGAFHTDIPYRGEAETKPNEGRTAPSDDTWVAFRTNQRDTSPRMRLLSGILTGVTLVK